MAKNNRPLRFDTTYTIRLSTEKLDELREYCRKINVPYGEFMRDAIYEKMKKEIK